MSLLGAAWGVLVMAAPNMLTFFIELAIPMSSPIFVGHLGSATLLGASTIATMFANALGYSFGLGFAMGLDSLCAAAYGARHYHLVGRHCQRAMLMLSILCLPIALIWLNADKLLGVMFGVSDETTQLSVYYIRRLLPGVWPWFMFECMKRWLQAQHINWPVTAAALTTACSHLITSYTLVFHLGLGYGGAAWATTISNWMLPTTCLIALAIRHLYMVGQGRGRGRPVHSRQYMVVHVAEDDLACSPSVLAGDKLDHEKDACGDMIVDAEAESSNPTSILDTWPSIFSREVLRGWGAYAKLGVPSGLGLSLEWGSYEITAAIAAHINPASPLPLATQAVLSVIANIWCTPAAGLSVGGSVVVGNMLGANNPSKAKTYAIVSMMLAIMYGVVNGGLGMVYRNYVGWVVSSDAEVVALTGSMMWVMWLYTIGDACKWVGGGMLRALGRPHINFFGSIVSCVLVMIPSCMALGLKTSLGLHGVWLGMALSWFALAALYVFVISRVDWEQEALQAVQRCGHTPDTKPIELKTSSDALCTPSCEYDKTDYTSTSTLPSTTPPTSFTVVVHA